MQTTTRNLWYDANRTSMQPEFHYTGRPLFTYRDVQVFKSAAGGYDYVLAGATITQRAGFSRERAPEIIDELLTGTDPHSSAAVCDHIAAITTGKPTWAVKCDDCKATIRRTEDVRESYAGGTCDACREKRPAEPRPAIRCQHYRGEYPEAVRCTAAATALLVGPDGDEKLSRQCASFYCEEHGTEIAAEYLEKLGETWSLRPLETRQ